MHKISRYFLIYYKISFPKLMAEGYLTRKSFAREIFKCVYLSSSFHNHKIVIKFKYLILFKLNKLMMVAIGKKPVPSDHESSLINLIMKNCPLQDIYPCVKLIYIYIQVQCSSINTRWLFIFVLKLFNIEQGQKLYI